MASASHALLRSLLRQSDRHPIGHLDGLDLDGADPGLIEHLLTRGVLCEIRRLDRVGELAVARDGSACWAVSLDGEEADQAVDPRSLQQFDIDPGALAACLAEGAALSGPIEQIDRQLVSLGCLKRSTAVMPVFLAWRLRDHSVQALARSIRQLVSKGPVLLLTPTRRDLGLEAHRALQEQGIEHAAVEALLTPEPVTGFRLDLASVCGRASAAPRLVIRKTVRSVVLDGATVKVAPQPFELLVLLAARALENRAHASRRDIDDALFQGKVHGHDLSDIVRRLRQAFVPLVGGVSRAEALIENKNRFGYRLALQPAEIDLG
jgi:hypothetical protein